MSFEVCAYYSICFLIEINRQHGREPVRDVGNDRAEAPAGMPLRARVVGAQLAGTIQPILNKFMCGHWNPKQNCKWTLKS